MTPMSDGPRWIRHAPDRAQERAALALAVGVGVAVGATVLYLARLFGAREPLEPAPRTSVDRPPRRREEGRA